MPEQLWKTIVGSEPPILPAARATWLLQQRRSIGGEDLDDALLDDTIWRCLSSWRRSGLQYAVAVDLWGRASSTCMRQPWPPCDAVLSTYAFYFKNGKAMRQYLSHLRSVLQLLQAQIGLLEHTASLVRGSLKAFASTPARYRARAHRRSKLDCWHSARDELDHKDVADSWVVARHFCLRYGSEAVPLEGNGRHSTVTFSTNLQILEATMVPNHRKLQTAPVALVRRCICKLQGRRLCGVCVLKRRFTDGCIFPNVSYAESLALLKVAAELCGFERAMEWGTHAFRRGWADEALRAGGPAALFFSGGWRGVAAFGYVSAQSRGALLAAEWLVNHSDSSDADA